MANLTDSISDSFTDTVASAVDVLPRLFAALAIVVVGWLVARTVARLVASGVKSIEGQKHVKQSLDKMGVPKFDVSGVVRLAVYWAIFLVFINAAADVFDVPVVTSTFSSVLAFLPNIFAAAVVVVVTLLAASAIKNIILEATNSAKVEHGNILASVARGVVILFGLPLAVAQLGLDLSIINNNITIIVAGIMLAFGLAFGLGGRDAAAKIVNDVHKSFKK